MGFATRGGLHVLCYQHHTELSSESHEESTEPVVYACPEPGCLVRYEGLRGYFLDNTNQGELDQEILPRVSCRADRRPMYLADVQAQQRNFRLWKCPKCGATRTNEESLNEFEKKMGA